jgi:hypothetical protein
VINQIRNQKQDRAGECGEHAAPVRLLIFQLDKTIAGQKKIGAERIQRRIQIRKL